MYNYFLSILSVMYCNDLCPEGHLQIKYKINIEFRFIYNE